MSEKLDLLDGDFLDDWEGEVVELPDAKGPTSSAELLYGPSEAIFGAVADDLVARGWAIFPQEVNRKPGRIGYELISWQRDHQLAERLPSADALELWKRHCAHLNVACVMGPGSGNIFSLDVDVTDEAISRRIVALADEVLGYTPLRRVGNRPKIALFYRSPEGEVMDSIQRHFMGHDEEGNPKRSDHLLEVVGKGKPMTFFGRHHRTGRYFRWLDANPVSSPPDVAPVIAWDRLQEFLTRVDQDIMPFHRGASFSAEASSWEWDESREIYVPGRMSGNHGVTPWVENEDGKVVDGREAYLTSLTFQMARLNPGLPAEQLGSVVADHFASTAETTGRWSGNNLLREAISKARRLVSRIEAGEITLTRARRRGGAGRAENAPAAIFPKAHVHVDDDALRACGLEFLMGKTPHSFPVRVTNKRVDVSLNEEERLRQVGQVQEKLHAALVDFFSDVVKRTRDDLRASGVEPPRLTGDDAKVFEDVDQRKISADLHLLKAPTGAGKTSQTIRFIARHRRALFPARETGTVDERGQPVEEPLETYESETGARHSGTRPIVFLLPTYANIEELQKRVQGLNLGGTRKEIEKAALELGLIPEDQIEAHLADLQREAMNAGLKSMVYRGKVAAGCQMRDKVEVAQEAGINSSSLCRSMRKLPDGEAEEIFCKFYHSCPAITQKSEIQKSHVVFMPHAFMNLNIPHELKEVKAVIADERIHHLFLHTTTFPISSLMIARKPPRLTKKEKEEGLIVEDIMQERHDAVQVALDALKRGMCPAKALYEATDESGRGRGSYGFMVVKAALRVSGGGLQRDATITPETTMKELQEICSRPTGVDVAEEYRFWKIVEERMHALSHDDLVLTEIRNIERELENFQGDHDSERRIRLEELLARLRLRPLKAKGKRDMRIQFLRPHEDEEIREMVRISWRTKPNWIDRPMLLLDASAAPEIISKIWDGGTPKVHDIEGPLHVRVVGVVDQTFSNASLVGKPRDSLHEKARVARRLNRVRCALSAISAYYGWGRVVAGSSIIVRKAINTNWEGPANVDWCHYGAMRGLDFAKHHAAAFSVGRMEVPIHAIDGLVAALTYDDDEPEEPFDRSGTGRTEGDKPLMLPISVQNLRMRDGRVVEVPAPMYPGRWGRLMQKQYREEELNQFVGRLRPVYRQGDAPVWFAFSSVIPEDYVIDHLVHIDTIIDGLDAYWDCVRKSRGVVEPAVLAQLNPDIFRSAEDARRRMEMLGFDFESGVLDHPEGSRQRRRTKGFVSLAFRETQTSPPRYAYVMAFHEDHEAVLREMLASTLGIEPVEVVRCSQGPGRTAAQAREPDKIDFELGDMDTRRLKEEKAGEKAALYVFEGGFERVENRNGPAWPLSFHFNRSPNMRYADFEAMQSIDDLWKRLQYEREIRHPLTIEMDKDGNYENFGNHVLEQETSVVLPEEVYEGP